MLDPAAASSHHEIAALALRRRRGPRPLALHIGQARLAWGPVDTGRPPAPELGAFFAGVRTYWQHPHARRLPDPPTLWSWGATRLLDYGPSDGVPLVVVPSLINRAYVLDLTPKRSLLRHLSGRGVRPLLLDWGEPSALERRMMLTDYIVDRLEDALLRVGHATERTPLVLGYCMGGLLALAAAIRQPQAVSGLALLATPWDFHAGPVAPHAIDLLASATSATAGGLGGLPVDLIQAFFAGVDPLGVPRKFARFAGLDPHSVEAETFVAVEDWLNDGVPLGPEVAGECLHDWYGADQPMLGTWQVGDRTIRPRTLACPCLVAIPEHDRIVPVRSALALTEQLPAATVIRPASGHVGMVVGSRARRELWTPLESWLWRIAALQK